MGYIRNGDFRPLVQIGEDGGGVVRAFLWPSGCSSFYVGYGLETTALNSDRGGIRSEMRLVNYWLRFICGGFNHVWDVPLERNKSLIMVPREVMEMACSYGHFGNFDRESDIEIGRVEIHAPVGCAPFIQRWIVNYLPDS
jgi:hypothetical protein